MRASVSDACPEQGRPRRVKGTNAIPLRYPPPVPADPPHPSPAARWDARYRERLAEDRGTEDEPHLLLLAQAFRLPSRGRALDIAAGLGRNALWLAEEGLSVLAVDASGVACDHLARRAAALGLPVTALCRDLERDPLPDGPFDVVVNTLYLQRDLASQIERALAPGGLLLFSTFVENGTAHLEHKEYRLTRGELPSLFPSLEVLEFSEDPPHAERPEAALVAAKPR